MKQKPSPPHRRIYYGWVIVGLSAISMSFWFGIRTTFAIFYVALTDHFQWGRAEAAGAQSIAMFTYMIMAPIVGTLVDWIGPRKVILPGIILTGLGLFLCTQIQTLLQFYLFFGVIVGTGVTCLSIAPFTVLLTHWFEKKRGVANGLSGVGIGTGPLFFVPLFQYLIHHHGWQFAYFIFSLLIFVIALPLNLLFLKHRPEQFGLLPDGDLSHPIFGTESKQNEGDTSSTFVRINQDMRQLVKTVRFWSLISFPAFTVFGVYIIVVHQVRYLVDLGVDRVWAASLFAAMGALSAGFRFFWGWFSDRVGRELVYTLGGVCFSSGILFLILYQDNRSTALLYLFAFFFGAGWGSTAPLFMSIAGDLYKGKDFGLIYGIIEGVIGMGAAAGAWSAGYIFDRTQNYFWAFVLAILFSGISVLLAWFVAPRKFQQLKSPDG